MTKRPRAEDRAEVLYGLHPVLEALESGRRSVDRILVAREGGGAGLGRLLRLAREAGVPISHLPRAALAMKVGARAVHQGVAAIVSAVPYADPDEVCGWAAAREDGLLVLLDGVEDPHNLGAVVRTAAAAGAVGVLVGGEGTVGLTPAVAKVSAGAVERIPVAREPKPGRRLTWLKAKGFRVLALDPGGPEPWDAVDLAGRIALVVGAEGKGLRRGLLEAADLRVSIPLGGGVESLNLSVAVAVLLFEAARQRRRRAAGGGVSDVSVPAP